VKRHEGEVLGEVCGEYPGEYVAMANRAQSPCRWAFCDSRVSMVSIFLNSLFLDGTILRKYSTSFEKYSWSISRKSWSIFQNSWGIWRKKTSEAVGFGGFNHQASADYFL